MRICPSIVLSLLCIASASAGHHRHPTLAFLSPIHRAHHAVGAQSPSSPRSSSVAFIGGRNVLLAAATTTFPSDVNADDYVDPDVSDTERPTRVCVVGGGFGGVNAALTLSSLWSSSSSSLSSESDDGVVAAGDDSNSKNSLEITLIDPKERFVFLPLLYELCVGDADLDEVAPTYDSLLASSGGAGGGRRRARAAARIEHVRGSVTGIDVDENCVYYDTTTTTNGGDGGDGGTTGEDSRYVYDALVISTGMEADPSVVPGAAEHATTFHTIEDCYDVRRRLNLIKGERGGRGDREQKQLPPLDVVVVGGSYSGVELALNVKEELDESDVGDVNVTIVHRGSDILPFASQFNKDSAKRRLREAGVHVLTGASVTGVNVAAKDGVAPSPSPSPQPSSSSSSSEDDFLAEVQPRKEVNVRRKTSPAYSSETETSLIEETLPADLLLWTAGSSPPSPEGSGALNCSLHRDAGGRILVGRNLRASSSRGGGGAGGGTAADDGVGSVSNVFAIGDAARVVVDDRFPATAQVAIQQAPVAAYNVLATLRNAESAASRSGGPPRREKLLPFRYVELGEMMTLGSDDATIDSLGGLVKIDGPAASALRRIIYGVRMPTRRQRLTALAESAPKLVRSRVTETKRLKLRRDKGEKK